MKEAVITIRVRVPIDDGEKKPDGSFVMPCRVYTNFKRTVEGMIREKKDRYGKDFMELLESYASLIILEKAGVPFYPLATEAAQKIPGCEIQEVEE